MIVFGSIKGGAGATVVAGLAAVAAARSGIPTTVAGCDADLATAFGMTDVSERAGLHDVFTTPDVSSDAVDRLSVLLRPKLWLLPPGAPRVGMDLVSVPKGADGAALLVDASGVPLEQWSTMVQCAAASVLVTRPCLLALRRFDDQQPVADAIVLIDEPGRVLDRRDVEDVTGLPVLARIRHDRSIARAVDAGGLAHIGKVASRAAGDIVDWMRPYLHTSSAA